METAAHSSELVAAKTATEQLLDLRLSLQYLGVPIHDKAHVSGDNESVVNSSALPQAPPHTRHAALVHHRVREMVAPGMLVFAHVPGKINPADILSEAWACASVWPTLRPLLFWRGDTANLVE